MRKLICTALAAILTASIFATPVFAGEPAANSAGYMTKMESGDSIVLDGKRDKAYDGSRYVNVGSQITSSDDSLWASAEITWDGTYIYAYVDVFDMSVVSLSDDTKPWISDSVELFLCKGPGVPVETAVEQYRIDCDGNLTYFTNHGTSPTQYFGTSLSQFEGVASVDEAYGMGYSVEYKIPYSLELDDSLYFQVAVNSISENSVEPIVIGNKAELNSWVFTDFDSLICCSPFSELSDIIQLNADIAAIGTVNRENYAEKQSLIEAAETKASELETKYGFNASFNYGYASLFSAGMIADFYTIYGNVVFGDTDNSGTISAADALLVLQASVNKTYFSQEQALAGDVNNDYEITASDALIILQYAVKKVDCFPVDALFPIMEFSAPLYGAFYNITEGLTLSFTAENTIEDIDSHIKICIGEIGIAGSVKTDGDVPTETRIILDETGIYLLDAVAKTYYAIPFDAVDEGSLEDIGQGLLGDMGDIEVISSSSGFGYYEGLPCSRASITVGITDTSISDYQSKITLTGRVVAQKDGSIRIIITVTDENNNQLVNIELKDISITAGVDSSLFEIPSDYTLIESDIIL